MTYLDASFSAPYYVNEESSEAVSAALDAAVGQFAVSDWTLSELVGILARLVRMQRLQLREARDTMRSLEQDAREAMHVIEPLRGDFTLVGDLLLRERDVGLRTPDALHLAIAGNRKLVLYTLDKVLLQATNTLGFSASNANVD